MLFRSDHQILLQKLGVYGVEGTELSWFKSYLTDRTQKTVVDGCLSEARAISYGVPQGSIIGPLLFILYVNDLPDCIKFSNILLYADDTVLYVSAKDINIIEMTLNSELENVSDWFKSNKLTLNTKKTKFMIFGTSSRLKTCPPPDIHIDNTAIEQVDSFKYLGVVLDRTLSFSKHIEHIATKVNCRIAMLGRASKYLPKHLLLTLYKSLALPYMDYCDTVWDSCSCQLKNRLQILQNRALRIINKSNRYTPISELHNLSNILTLQQRRNLHSHVFMYKATHNLMPEYITSKFHKVSEIHSHNTRTSFNNSLYVQPSRLNIGKGRMTHRGAVAWNSLPLDIRNAPSLSCFKVWLAPVIRS